MVRKVLYHYSSGKDPRFSASDATPGYLLSSFLSFIPIPAPFITLVPSPQSIQRSFIQQTQSVLRTSVPKVCLPLPTRSHPSELIDSPLATPGMAIHPTLSSQANSQGRLTPQQTRAISAWSEQAAASLRNLTLSESVSAGDRNVEFISTRDTPLRGSSVPLSIPLDDPVPVVQTGAVPKVKLVAREPETQPVASVSFRRREPIRRDSLKRREALLKGKDGSRRRQRWENGMSCLVT